jgi:hypothetical protein
LIQKNTNCLQTKKPQKSKTLEALYLLVENTGVVTLLRTIYYTANAIGNVCDLGSLKTQKPHKFIRVAFLVL